MLRKVLYISVLSLGVTGIWGPSIDASANESKPAAISKPVKGTDLKKLCSTIIEEAREQRYARKEKELKDVMKQVEERIATLELKRAEYEKWVQRRDAFSQMATQDLVAIYSKMRPDAAAVRLEKLNARLAAAIIQKLKPRQAGLLLNEMNEDVAADLTTILASSAARKDPA